MLDNQGNFLRLLQPKDKVLAVTLQVEQADKSAAKAENTGGGEGQDRADNPSLDEGKQEQSKEEDNLPDIPEEFRPRSTQQGRPAGLGSNIAPVKVDDVAIGGNGRLYLLSHETGKVYVYGPDEKFLFSFGQKGGSTGQLAFAKGVAVDDSRGLIYVVDYMRHTIVVFDLNGKWLFEAGGRGAGPGWFNYPEALAINKQGQIVVADLFNKRVQVLELEYEKNNPPVKNLAGKADTPAETAQPEPQQAQTGAGAGANRSRSRHNRSRSRHNRSRRCPPFRPNRFRRLFRRCPSCYRRSKSSG